MSEPILEPAAGAPPAGHDLARSRHGRAIAWLLFATVLWGASFPLGKAVAIGQQQLLPAASTWFLSAYTLTFRFGAAALLLALFSLPTLARLTRSETWQGCGLGVFGGIGILFQIDGLAYTHASTSAFLTSSYCVTLPVCVAFRDRMIPPVRIIVCCLMVFFGVAVLAGVTWQSLRLGRGELETIIAALFFTGQILWLERPVFRGNRSGNVSVVMFAVTALIALPVGVAAQQSAADWISAARSPAVFSYLVVLAIACTLVTYSLMNRWQPFVSATEAGLIYCVEPIWASLMALSLPVWLGRAGGFSYPNETATTALLIGGALITVANVVVQWKPPPPPGAR